MNEFMAEGLKITQHPVEGVCVCDTLLESVKVFLQHGLQKM